MVFSLGFAYPWKEQFEGHHFLDPHLPWYSFLRIHSTGTCPRSGCIPFLPSLLNGPFYFTKLRHSSRPSWLELQRPVLGLEASGHISGLNESVNDLDYWCQCWESEWLMVGHTHFSLEERFPIFCFQQGLKHELIQLSAGRELKPFSMIDHYDFWHITWKQFKVLSSVRKLHPLLPLFILRFCRANIY